MRRLASLVVSLLLAACSSNGDPDPSCGSSCGRGGVSGSGAVSNGPYAYREDDCACPENPRMANSEGGPCKSESDCSDVCCTCATCSGRSYRAVACLDGKCASRAIACKIALDNTGSGTLCAK